jgi:hypothetical protein
VTNGTTTTASSGNTSVIHSDWQVIALFAAVGILGLAWLAITFYDRRSVNRWRTKHYDGFLKDLLDSDKLPSMSADELASFEKAIREPPRGQPGLTRTLLALGLLTLVGVGLVALLVGNSAAAGDTLKATITALTAALTTVVGFYFGAKTAADAQAPPKPTQGAPGPVGPKSGPDSGGAQAGDQGAGGTPAADPAAETPAEPAAPEAGTAKAPVASPATPPSRPAAADPPARGPSSPGI